MALQIYIDGQWYAKENAKISVFDHGLLYGDGVFEGMRSYGGKVFRMKEHLDRLYDSARAIFLTIPLSPQAMEEAVYETLRLNGLTDGYVRLVVTRGVGDLGLNPNLCPKASIIIIADKISLYPAKLYEEGMEIVTASTVRNHPAAVNPRIKSLNYLGSILAKIEGLKAGCNEALMLNLNGEVAECTADNIFLVKNGRIATPHVNAGILDGITRRAVIDLAKQAGIEVAETTLTRHDVYVADECFLTGSAAEVIPVIKVDSRPIGTGQVGPLTKQLIQAFKALVAK
ncbi:MAG: branched-chain-amino-acid transaminase [Planctomycetaceae bacterium]|nr:branched-chain-amino-acid transaminase [Planctomycetaceae bacterium]